MTRNSGSSAFGYDVEREVLGNGMEVYLLEDHRSPVFTFQVWFKVGSSYEDEGSVGAPGITGISHFLEHLMFKGTRRYPDYFGAVYARGGQLNAWTWLDSTCYWQKLPAGNLPFVVDIEADRLKNLRFDLVALEREREVVRNERLLRSVNDPDGAMDELLAQLAFSTSPYRWPVIGREVDIVTLTPARIREYFLRHYNPANGFVVLVGDFDPEEALRELEAGYGAIPRVAPPRRSGLDEPPQTSERRGYVEHKVAAGKLHMAFKAPRTREDDFMVLDVVDYMLTRGKSARLLRELVYCDDPVATKVNSALWPMTGPHLYEIDVDLTRGGSEREVMARVDRVLEELRTTPVSQEELAKAINGMRADLVRSQLDTQRKADLIGFSVLTTGDPHLFHRRLEQAQELTPEDIRRVAARYLVPEGRTVITAFNPDRLSSLTARVLGRGPIHQAADIRTRRRELARREERAATEALAIEALRERLAAEEAVRREAGEPVDELVAFRDDSEKGPVARARALEAEREAIARIEEELRREEEALQVEDPDTPEGRLALAMVGRGQPPGVEEVAAVEPMAEAEVLLIHLGMLLEEISGSGAGAGAFEAALALDARSGEVPSEAGDVAWILTRVPGGGDHDVQR